MKRLSETTDTVPVTVKMPIALRDALDKIAEAEGVNRSVAARVVLERGLNGRKPKR